MSRKAITLLLEAHGEEYLDIEVNVPRVELLSFSGKTGESGDFGIVDNESLELSILKLLRNLYSDKSSVAQQEKVYKSDTLSTELRRLYEEEAGKGYPNGGFVRTQPIRERVFYFEPNPHEDCRRCKRVPKMIEYTDGTVRPNPVYAKVCIPNRKLATNLCPVYGLIVVSSSDNSDKPYTLESSRGEGIAALSTANLHMNIGSKLHWYQKINATRFPQASIAFQHMIQNRNISLTQLSKIFEAMGYTDIYVLDPSCRDATKRHTVKPPTRFQAAVHSVTEKNKRARGLASISDAVTYARPVPSTENPNPEIIDETTDMEINDETADTKVDNETEIKVDGKGNQWKCNIANGVCTLIGAATTAFSLAQGNNVTTSLGLGAGTGVAARGLIKYKTGYGGKKSKKQKKIKRKNKNKTRKHK